MLLMLTMTCSMHVSWNLAKSLKNVTSDCVFYVSNKCTSHTSVTISCPVKKEPSIENFALKAIC